MIDRFTDAFLDEVRARVPITDLGGEFVTSDDAKSTAHTSTWCRVALAESMPAAEAGVVNAAFDWKGNGLSNGRSGSQRTHAPAVGGHLTSSTRSPSQLVYLQVCGTDSLRESRKSGLLRVEGNS